MHALQPASFVLQCQMPGGTLETVSQPLHFRERQFRGQALASGHPRVSDRHINQRQCRRLMSRVTTDFLDYERQDIQLAHAAQLRGNLSEALDEFLSRTALQSQERD